MKSQRLNQKIAFIIAVALGCFSLMIDISALKLVKNIAAGFPGFVELLCAQLKPISMELTLASAMLVLCARLVFRKQDALSLDSIVLSMVFSAFLVLGESVRYHGNFDFIFYAKKQTVIAFLVFSGYSTLLYIIIEAAKRKLGEWLLVENDGIDRNERQFFWNAFLTIIICWIVFSLPYFPGSVPHDGRRQLIMFDGYAVMSNGHPYIATLVMGTVASVGRMLFGNNYGVVLVVILQMVFGTYVFARISNTIRIRLSEKAAWLIVLFYALCPLWWTYVQAVIKDTVFFISISWLTLLCFEVFWGEKKVHFIENVVAVFFICAFRNEGVFYAILLLGLTILLTKNSRKAVLFILCLTIIMGVVTEVVTVYGIKVLQRSPFESRSIVVQQIARVIKQKPNEITQTELEIVDEVLEVDGIQNRYDPQISDPVKNNWHSDASEEEWTDFWELWLKWAKKYPDVYLEAIAEKSFGYFDPLYFYNGAMKYQLYNKNNLQTEDKGVVYSEYLTDTKTRDMIYDIVCAFDCIPFVSLFVNPAAYVWLFVILLIMGGQKRAKYYLLVPLMNLIICVGSPVNGYMRYMLPMVASMPLYIALVFDNGHNISVIQEI